MFAVFTVLGLLGCPLPPDESDGPQIPTLNQGNNQNNRNAGGGRPQGAPPSGGGSPPSDGENMGNKPMEGGAGKPSGGPGGVLLDMTQMIAQKTQEEISTQDHVKVTGVVLGECEGDVRLDIIETESLGGPKEGDLKGPITTLNLDGVGEFTALVPKSSSINLTALCDADKNQKITADVDQLSLGARLGVVDEDVSDVSLTLEEIKPPSGDEKPSEDD
jgi:hypothetical protein